jgi:hypothetical protein
MNYKNFLGLGLITLTTLATSPMSFAASPPPAPPLRLAKATVQILRVEVSFDNATGKGDHKRTPICTQVINLPVSDARKNGYAVPGNVQCKDTVNGQDISINTGAIFALQRGSVVEGTPETDFKYLAVYSRSEYLTSAPQNQLPDIPSNMSYSKDLDQKFFGALSMPKQFVNCQAESVPSLPQDPNPNKPTPNPRPQSTNCSVVNPLGYQVVWEVEDTI